MVNLDLLLNPDQLAHFYMVQSTASITHNIGFSTANSTALNLLTVLLKRFFENLVQRSKAFAVHANRVDVSIIDVVSALKEKNFDFLLFRDYLNEVGSFKLPHKVPKFPVRKNVIDIVVHPNDSPPREMLRKDYAGPSTSKCQEKQPVETNSIPNFVGKNAVNLGLMSENNYLLLRNKMQMKNSVISVKQLSQEDLDKVFKKSNNMSGVRNVGKYKRRKSSNGVHPDSRISTSRATSTSRASRARSVLSDITEHEENNVLSPFPDAVNLKLQVDSTNRKSIEKIDVINVHANKPQERPRRISLRKRNATQISKDIPSKMLKSEENTFDADDIQIIEEHIQQVPHLQITVPPTKTGSISKDTTPGLSPQQSVVQIVPESLSASSAPFDPMNPFDILNLKLTKAIKEHFYNKKIKSEEHMDEYDNAYDVSYVEEFPKDDLQYDDQPGPSNWRPRILNNTKKPDSSRSRKTNIIDLT